MILGCQKIDCSTRSLAVVVSFCEKLRSIHCLMLLLLLKPFLEKLFTVVIVDMFLLLDQGT